ncbi:MAG: uracil-DNA glycosylase [Dehalogenimonas sp.]
MTANVPILSRLDLIPDIAADSLEKLHTLLHDCCLCELRFTCTAPVPGLGPLNPKYMIIGEAPGREEDRAGVPFIGWAGKKLNQLLEVGSINPNDCYITNVCRCRPPSNRKPKIKEIRVCVRWLLKEIRLVKPEKIITLGSTPLSLFTPHGIKVVHGTRLEFDLPETA